MNSFFRFLLYSLLTLMPGLSWAEPTEPLTYEEIFSSIGEIRRAISTIDETQFKTRVKVAFEIERRVSGLPRVRKVSWPESAESVVVELADGTPYIFFNRFQKSTTDSAPTFHRPKETDVSFTPAQVRLAELTARPQGRGGLQSYNYVMLGKRALLINAYAGDVFTKQSEVALQKMLTQKGYQVDIANGSLNDFRNVVNYDFFWTSGHGGELSFDISSDPTQPVQVKYYGLLTNHRALDPSQLSNEERKLYRTLMAEHKIAIGQANAQSPTFWAILPNFVRDHWKFNTPASLAILDHCSSATDDAFMTQLKKNGLQRFFGWSAVAWSNKAGEIVRRLVDISLGTNETSSMTPKARPFNIEDTFVYLEGKGLTIDDTQPAGPQHIQADLKFLPMRNPMSPHLLAPTIRMVNLDPSRKTAQLIGDFAPQDAGSQVTLDGKPMKSSKWKKDSIVIDFPFSGQAQYGSIEVVQNDHKSNPVPITQWAGTFEISTPIKTMGSTENNYKLACGLRFIEDFRAARASVSADYKPLSKFNLEVVQNDSDECTWTAQGKLESDNKTTEFGPSSGTFSIKDISLRLAMQGMASSNPQMILYFTAPGAEVSFITKNKAGKVIDSGTVPVAPHYEPFTGKLPADYKFQGYGGTLRHDLHPPGGKFTLNLNVTDLPNADTQY
jgi:hypothetical protein